MMLEPPQEEEEDVQDEEGLNVERNSGEYLYCVDSKNVKIFKLQWFHCMIDDCSRSKTN